MASTMVAHARVVTKRSEQQIRAELELCQAAMSVADDQERLVLNSEYTLLLNELDNVTVL